MTKIGLIRCEKNEKKCPLTGCITCLSERKQGFRDYEESRLAGVFTCRGDLDDVEDMAKILKAKGAEVIHVPTCLFANKTEGKWVLAGGGLCDRLPDLADRVRDASGLPCLCGTAHLPEGYAPRA